VPELTRPSPALARWPSWRRHGAARGTARLRVQNRGRWGRSAHRRCPSASVRPYAPRVAAMPSREWMRRDVRRHRRCAAQRRMLRRHPGGLLHPDDVRVELSEVSRHLGPRRRRQERLLVDRLPDLASTEIGKLEPASRTASASRMQILVVPKVVCPRAATHALSQSPAPPSVGAAGHGATHSFVDALHPHSAGQPAPHWPLAATSA
jgi:hypothetical protein